MERPQGTGEGLSEIGSERRYATRQSARKQQGGQLANMEPDKVSSTAPVLRLAPVYGSVTFKTESLTGLAGSLTCP